MTLFDVSVMFVLGLVSSLHCVQMCGPIVLAYSAALGDAIKQPSSNRLAALVKNHLAYNSGRILTYSILGAVAGVAGGTFSWLGRLSGFTHTVAIIAGTLMILVGIVMLQIIPARFLGSSLFRIPSLFLRRIGGLLSSAGSSNRFVLGLTLGFLPCGLIYGALLKAMATASPLVGAASMAAFGLGTAISLLAFGMFSSVLRLRLNRWGSQLAAVGVALLGVVLVWRGTVPNTLMMGGHMHVHH